MFKNIHILECGQKWGYNMWEFYQMCLCWFEDVNIHAIMISVDTWLSEKKVLLRLD